MKFNLSSYQPINYRTWILGDKARQGINIKRLGILTTDELKVWEASEEFHDARNDPGHAETSTYFAITLLPYYPKAKREIVVPTIMLHDDGWYGGDPNAWKKAVKIAHESGNLASLDSPEKRKAHQDKGAEMALRLFKKINYPPEQYHQECVDIILDHDTRLNPMNTTNERVVWDSDYLWRVTYPCNQIYLFNEGINNPTEVLKRAEETCLNTKPPKNLGEVAKQIAKIELANSLVFKFGSESVPLLREKGYEKELRRIITFYE